MKKITTFFLFLFLVFGSPVSNTLAQGDGSEAIPPSEFFRAKVVEIIEEGNKELAPDYKQPFQKLKVKILSGSEKGKEVEIEHGSLYALQESQKVKKGDYLVVTKASADVYYISDRFRIYPVVAVLAILLAAIFVATKKKMLGYVVAMGTGAFVLGKYAVPQVMLGTNPVVVSALMGIGVIALMSFLGSGLERKNFVVFLSSSFSLLLVLGMGVMLLNYAAISGSGGRDVIFLQTGAIDPSGVKGLLLLGLTLGTAGAMVYVSNKVLSGTKFAGEELLSIVSILFFAYLGTSIAVLMLFGVNQAIPFWVTANSEFVIEEVIRILGGIAGVMLVFKVTSFTAEKLALSPKQKGKEK